jgi:hypothetical protein
MPQSRLATAVRTGCINAFCKSGSGRSVLDFWNGSTVARPSVLPATVPTGRGPTIRFPLPGSPAAPREGARRTPRPRGSNDDGRRSRPWRQPKRRPRSGRCNPSRKRGPVRSGRVRDAPQRFIAIIGAVVLSLEERRLLSSGRGPLSAHRRHRRACRRRTGIDRKADIAILED